MDLVSPYTSRPLVNQWCQCMGSNLVPYDYKSNEQSIMLEQITMIFFFLLNPDKIIVFHFIGLLLFLSCLFLDYKYIFICVRRDFVWA